MAQKTFKELVNAVLVELREDQVGTVASTAYSSLIGRFVNTAKTIVEDSWDWACNRFFLSFQSDGVNRSFDISTGTTLSSFAGTATNERSKLVFDPETEQPMALDTTSGQKFQLYYFPFDVIDRRYNVLTNPTNAVPSDFGLSTEPGDGFRVWFDCVPENGRTYNMWFYTPQDDLSTDGDTLRIPWRPVVAFAANLARHERGEEVGEPNTIGGVVYRQLLSDAILLDSFNRSGIYTFTPH